MTLERREDVLKSTSTDQPNELAKLSRPFGFDANQASRASQTNKHRQTDRQTDPKIFWGCFARFPLCSSLLLVCCSSSRRGEPSKQPSYFSKLHGHKLFAEQLETCKQFFPSSFSSLLFSHEPVELCLLFAKPAVALNLVALAKSLVRISCAHCL